MSLPGIAFVVFGLACVALGGAHEFTWFRRRGGLVVKGLVVEIVEDRTPSEGGSFCRPRIEYSIGGETRDFVSTYGSVDAEAVGTHVDVLLSSDGKDAEVLNSRNRLLFSVIPLAFGLLFIVVGFGIRH